MKYVHSSKQLMHLFCSMTNADLEGHRTSSRNIYFSNGVLYSYGSHYPMAVKTSFGMGSAYREVILINSEKSTVTTQKHKSQLWSSTTNLQWVFHVPNVLEPKAVENREHLMNCIVDSIDSVLRCLRFSSIDSVTKSIEGYNQYAKAFGFASFKLDPVFYSDLAVLSRETEKKNETKDAERWKKQDVERAANRERWASEVALWYQCKNTTNISSAYFGLNYDPIRVNGDIVESPRGAQVPLKDAKVFCQLLKEGKINIGMKIGSFEVQDLSENFITIGCHKILITQALSMVLGGA